MDNLKLIDLILIQILIINHIYFQHRFDQTIATFSKIELSDLSKSIFLPNLANSNNRN